MGNFFEYLTTHMLILGCKSSKDCQRKINIDKCK